MMCKYPKNGKTIVYVEMELSGDGSNYLEVLNDETSDNVNQPYIFYSRRPRFTELDFGYQPMYEKRGGQSNLHKGLSMII